jgi:hypothetical protein
MRWGFDIMHRALLASTATDKATVRQHAEALKSHLNAWATFGTNLGDIKDQNNYGNLPLELTWFMGNVARSGSILAALSADPDSGATGIWSSAEHARFATWSRALRDKYITFSVFPAGLSNRKASQIETIARIAELEPDPTKRRAEVATAFNHFKALLENAMQDSGFIPEDSCRDKYHDQFFLASATQSRELFAAYGMTLAKDSKAANRLINAVTYAAKRNMNNLKPAECSTIGDPNPNYGIPYWILAPRLYADFGLSRPAEVGTMIQKQYYDRVGYALVMQWGFNGIALSYGLAGNVAEKRQKSVSPTPTPTPTTTSTPTPAPTTTSTPTPAPGCSLSGAVDLGERSVRQTVQANACLKITKYPSWWTTQDLTLQSGGVGSLPLSFTWQNCSGVGGSASFTGTWQNVALKSVSSSCPTLITLKGTGSFEITWF